MEGQVVEVPRGLTFGRLRPHPAFFCCVDVYCKVGFEKEHNCQIKLLLATLAS